MLYVLGYSADPSGSAPQTGIFRSVRVYCTGKGRDAPLEPQKCPTKRHGRAARFFQRYLMFAGALATLYVLFRLLVLLFVEIGKWM